MIPIFSTPRKYREAGALFMVVNLGNILTFSGYLANWSGDASPAFAQGIMIVLFHLMTIILLSVASGRLWSDGNKFEKFIQLMESNGFLYDQHTKEFKPGAKF